MQDSFVCLIIRTINSNTIIVFIHSSFVIFVILAIKVAIGFVASMISIELAILFNHYI